MERSPERAIGIELYYTKTEGLGGRLKTTAQDFIVNERSIYPKPDPEGRFTIATVTSTNWETNRLIRQFSKVIRCSRKRISFAGTKDKRAVTTQLLCFNVPMEEVERVSITDVQIKDIYRSSTKVTIGDLHGNDFKIIIGNIPHPSDKIKQIMEENSAIFTELEGYPNFFGVQRFGVIRPITHIIGKHIVNRDFEKAVMAYIANPEDAEPEETRQARETLQRTNDFTQAFERFPKHLIFEKSIIHHLINNPTDWTGALCQLPQNLLTMFIHAYQSYLFNRMLSERIARGIPLDRPVIGDIILPLSKNGLPDHLEWIPVNSFNIDKITRMVRAKKAFISGLLFGSEAKFAEGPQGEIEHEIIEKEGFSPEKFIIHEIPRITSRGIRRELLAPLSNYSYAIEDDTVTVTFSLTKGCYATTLLREFLKGEMISY